MELGAATPRCPESTPTQGQDQAQTSAAYVRDVTVPREAERGGFRSGGQVRPPTVRRPGRGQAGDRRRPGSVSRAKEGWPPVPTVSPTPLPGASGPSAPRAPPGPHSRPARPVQCAPGPANLPVFSPCESSGIGWGPSHLEPSTVQPERNLLSLLAG